MKVEEVANRLRKAIAYLKGEGVIKYDKDVADAIGADKNTVSQAFMGSENYLTSNFIRRVCDAYEVLSYMWIVFGEGDMLNDNTNSPKVMEDGKNNAYNLVPVYNFDAVGSMDKSNDITDAPAYIERYIPFPGARKDDICVHVTGNSMIPTYSSGSLLLIRKVEGWREYFGYGHCYVLMLKDGRRILKEVRRSEVDHKQAVLCVSHNPSHQPEELPRDFIVDVYKVVMTLTNEGY